MLKLIVTYFFVCVAFTTSVGAGYTDELWNESEDREYYDCGDWSGIENNQNTNLHSHYYFYSKHRSNWKSMFTQKTWGYPDDANLKTVGFSNVAWSCVHIRGFDKTLNVAGTIYTDNQCKINYKTSYLSYRGWTTQYWSIYDVESIIAISDTGDRVTVTNRITFYGKHAKKGEDNYKDVISTPSDSIDYAIWGIPNLEINATITEHRGYSILDIPTPPDVVGIRITAKNRTAVYEKYSHCLKPNSTKSGYQYYDLIECDVRTFSGIFPYGTDRYLIDGEPSNISVTLFTPFEGHNATLTITTIECTTDEPTHFKNHSMYVLAMFLLPVVLTIWLYRRF